MPGLNGLQVAALLKNKPVIFTTAYHDYAADAFDLDAIDYLRKPIQRERLEKALEKARQRIQIQSPARLFFQWNTNKGKAVIFFDQLLYITTSDTDKRDKLALLEGGQELVLKNISFEQLLHELPVKQFCRVNKKDIIALRSVRFFSADEIATGIVLPDGKELKLQLGESYRQLFHEVFHQR
jgi:DNA-binding LytR/AlgR family response regulator